MASPTITLVKIVSSFLYSSSRQKHSNLNPNLKNYPNTAINPNDLLWIAGLPFELTGHFMMFKMKHASNYLYFILWTLDSWQSQESQPQSNFTTLQAFGCWVLKIHSKKMKDSCRDMLSVPASNKKHFLVTFVSEFQPMRKLLPRRNRYVLWNTLHFSSSSIIIDELSQCIQWSFQQNNVHGLWDVHRVLLSHVLVCEL